MVKNLIKKIKKNFEILSLVLLVIFTAIFTTYLNNIKKDFNDTYVNLIDNVYLKKTLSYLVENLEPKYKKINHICNYVSTYKSV